MKDELSFLQWDLLYRCVNCGRRIRRLSTTVWHHARAPYSVCYYLDMSSVPTPPAAAQTVILP